MAPPARHTVPPIPNDAIAAVQADLARPSIEGSEKSNPTFATVAGSQSVDSGTDVVAMARAVFGDLLAEPEESADDATHAVLDDYLAGGGIDRTRWGRMAAALGCQSRERNSVLVASAADGKVLAAGFANAGMARAKPPRKSTSALPGDRRRQSSGNDELRCGTAWATDDHVHFYCVVCGRSFEPLTCQMTGEPGPKVGSARGPRGSTPLADPLAPQSLDFQQGSEDRPAPPGTPPPRRWLDLGSLEVESRWPYSLRRGELKSQEAGMAVFTDCDLVVVGSPAEIGAMETTQTERTRAALRAGYASWDRGGWPSLHVVRVGNIDSGCVHYMFEVQNGNPARWAADQAQHWPRLEFRANCMLDDNDPDSPGVIYRRWYSGTDVIRSEDLSREEADHWGVGGRRRWLEEAGITAEDLAPEVRIALDVPTHADSLAAVRTAIVDGSFSNDRPVLIQATVALSVGADEASEWLQLAEEGGGGAAIARARLEWLADALREGAAYPVSRPAPSSVNDSI